MKLSQFIHAVPLSGTVKDSKENIVAFCCHSKQVLVNSAFIALEEDAHKRRSHLREAMDRGAKLLICPLEDQILSSQLETLSVLYSKNPRRDYALLSRNWFENPGDSMTLIGVTGTNGKTTTTHIIKSMLEGLEDGKQRKVGLIGTNENKIGEKSLPSHRTTPDSYELNALLRMMREDGCTHVVMEVSSHGLVQHRTTGLHFEVGIFTNLTQDHLDYHKTMEEYKEAKALLFTQSNYGIFNLDDVVGEELVNRCQCRTLTYSENKTYATLLTEQIKLSSQYISFNCIHGTHKVPVFLPIPGGFSMYNALASLACGLALQLPLLKLAQTLPKIQGVKGRLEVVPTPSEFTVMIDYAHTPDALENILLTAENITQGRLICLFGCGGNRDRGKRPLMGNIAESIADILVVTSDNPRFEDPEEIIRDIMAGFQSLDKEIMIIPTRKEAIFWALSQGKPGDVILLAGKGHECYQEINGETFPLDEREIVAEYFANNSTANCKKTQEVQDISVQKINEKNFKKIPIKT